MTTLAERAQEATTRIAEAGDTAARMPPKVAAVNPPSEWTVATNVVIDGWQISLSDDCPEGMCHVDQASATVTLRQRDWEVVREYFSPSEFLDHVANEDSGMRRVISDAGKYRKASQDKAQANGSDQADRLTRLASRANGLLVQAASLNAQASAYQLETFSTRLGELREEYDEIEAELEQARELINLAATAVVDASE